MSYAEYISELITCTPAELKGQEKTSLLRLMELSYKNEGIHSYLWFKKQLPFSAEDERLLTALVDRNLIAVFHGKRLRRGDRNYLLTTCGLFYILSDNQVFSGMLLSKYRENVILRMLLFQYFEENTVKNWSPQAGIIISDYLHKCCVTSKRAIETIKSSRISEDRDKYLKILDLDLKVFAFCLGIRLTRLYSRYKAKERDHHTGQLNHEEDKMLSLLTEDNRFSQFRSSTLMVLDEAFEELAKSKSE